MTYILKVTNHGILAQRSPTGLAKSGHKIQAKNNARSSVLLSTKPRNRFRYKTPNATSRRLLLRNVPHLYIDV